MAFNLFLYKELYANYQMFISINIMLLFYYKETLIKKQCMLKPAE
jgi:hypothetical protein